MHESFSEKKYSPRNIEGDKNSEALEVVRELHYELSQVPEFVAIVPEGSSFKGYSTEKSDIDITILFDSGDVAPSSEQYQEQKQRIKEVVEQYKENFWDKKRELNEKLQNIDIKIVDVDKERLSKSLSEGRFEELSNIFKMTTGNTVENYRSALARRINELPEEEKRKVIDEITKALVRKDVEVEKLKSRMASEDEEDTDYEREGLWRDWVTSVVEGAQ